MQEQEMKEPCGHCGFWDHSVCDDFGVSGAEVRALAKQWGRDWREVWALKAAGEDSQLPPRVIVVLRHLLDELAGERMKGEING